MQESKRKGSSTRTESAPMHLIGELMRYMDFDEFDGARLRELGPRLAHHFTGLVDEFYEALYANPRTAAVFTDQAQRDRLRLSLHQWLEEIFAGTYDESYWTRRAQIGRVHVSVGLSPHFVSGAMNIVRRGLERAAILEEQERGELTEHVASVHKIMDMELSLMHQSYWDRLMEDRLRVPQAMAMGLAHEIRNPLNSLGLNLTLLERRMKKAEVAQDFSPLIESMRQEVRRIGSMTTEIMDFAKPIALDSTWVEACYLLEMLRASHESALAASGIALALECEPGDELWCDRDRLMQALVNLVTNAAEAIEQGGRIEVSILNEDAHTVVSVVDDGHGMDPDQRYEIFELFHTDKISGTGLGLPIVQKIVEAHDGSIDVLTQPGRGTTFTIFLPRRQP